jgi:hypothetical protein
VWNHKNHPSLHHSFSNLQEHKTRTFGGKISVSACNISFLPLSTVQSQNNEIERSKRATSYRGDCIQRVYHDQNASAVNEALCQCVRSHESASLAHQINKRHHQ